MIENENTNHTPGSFPDENLFNTDVYTWITEHPSAVPEEMYLEFLINYRVMNLTEFYLTANKVHPDLKTVIPDRSIINYDADLTSNPRVSNESIMMTELWIHSQVGLTELSDLELLRSNFTEWIKKYGSGLSDAKKMTLILEGLILYHEEFRMIAVQQYPELDAMIPLKPDQDIYISALSTNPKEK